MMSANAKANIKIRNIRNKRSGGCILHFFKKQHQNLKYNNIKEGVFLI